MKGDSPFRPGSPVPVELFVGRQEQIEEILRYVRATTSGKQENVFLTGERGIGKSSLAAYLRQLVASRENVLGVHVFLGHVETLDEFVRCIFEAILKEAKAHRWYERVSGFFGKYVTQIDLFGISVRFDPPKEDLTELVRSFPEALWNVSEKIRDERKGIFIVLDDINGLARRPDFANWYKSFVDYAATHYKSYPVLVMPTGIPAIRDALSSHQPSLMRVFRVVDIAKLSDAEVRDFFQRAFEKVNMTVEPDALASLVRYSSGLPIFMHEIGDAVFWVTKDNTVTPEDAAMGIINAAESIGRKYLDPRVYRAIRSTRYISILRKLGEQQPIRRDFTKRDLEAALTSDEKKVLHNFLQKMRALQVIEQDPEAGRGSYRFTNEMYPVYIYMESMRSRGRKR